jgi:glycosyltransferase involved in cell wall biosynthesis
MKAARVFASSATRDGFGITSLEAMATNCAVTADSVAEGGRYSPTRRYPARAGERPA